MGIIRNKNGTYGIFGKYKNIEGEWISYKRFTGKNGFKTQKEAKQEDLSFLKNISFKHKSLKSNLESELTFSELKKMYFEEAKYRLKHSTIITDIDVLKLFANLDKLLITSISSNDIQIRLRTLDSKNYSLSYLSKCYYTLKKIFDFACEEKILIANPMSDVRKITRPNRVENKRIKFWTPEQFQLFISQVEEPLYRAYFCFLLYTGCRRGEGAAIFWKDIDFNNNTFDIHKTYYEHEGKDYFTPPKTNNSIRIQKMPSVLVSEMKKWKDIQKPYNDDCLVFGYTSPPKNTTVDRYFKKYIDKANLPPISIHGLRHSHISLLINNGANPQDVAVRVGNTVEMINKTYSHWFPNRENKIIEAIDSFFKT